MKVSLKTSVITTLFNTIIFLIALKLLFSFLSLELHYFQRDLTPDFQKYNFFGLKRNFSNTIEYVLAPLLLLFIITYYRHYKVAIYFLIFSLVAYGLNLVNSLVNNSSLIESLSYSLKFFVPIYFFCALMIYSKANSDNLKSVLQKALCFCLILIFLAILFFNPSLNRLQVYLPIYFGNVHTHSYLVTVVLMGIGYLLYRKGYKYRLLLFLGIAFFFSYFGYGVRTATIMFLLYSLVLTYLISDVFKILVVKIVVFSPIILGTLFLTLKEIDWVSFSSGRTAMYQDKLEQLSHFSFLDWLIGKGAGADLIQTKVWWWAKKGAHSDIFTMLVENGIVYTALILFNYFFQLLLVKRLNLIFFILLFSSFFSGVISNGIAFRPHANYIFYLVLAYVLTDIKSRSKTIRHTEPN